MVWGPVRAALEAGLDPVVAVTGGERTGSHEAIGAFQRARPPRRTEAELRRVVNPHPEEGLASSLRIGLSALGPDSAAVVILLGDMPWVGPGTIRALVEAFRRDPECPCVPVHEGSRGNPVLWPASFFPALEGLEGDRGARDLLAAPEVSLREVPVDDPGIHRDVDTPGELAALNDPD